MVFIFFVKEKTGSYVESEEVGRHFKKCTTEFNTIFVLQRKDFTVENKMISRLS